MTQHDREQEQPRRWREAAHDELTVEADIGRAVRLVAEPVVPDEERLAALRRMIVSRESGPERRAAGVRAFYRRVPPWLLAASCVVLGSVATAIAGIAFLHYERRPPAEAPASPADRERDRDGRGKGPQAGVADVPSPIEDRQPGLPAPRAQSPVAAPRRTAMTAEGQRTASAPLEPETRAENTEPPPLTPAAGAGAPGEASGLAEALRALRADRDPARALAILELNERRFPDGPLRREATLARAEALAALGRQADALAALDGVTIAGGESERAVALLRAELRASARRCNEAINDFSHALAGEGTDDLAARAFYGRGACRLQGGDNLGARADFEIYQRNFPNGAFNVEVTRALERLAR